MARTHCLAVGMALISLSRVPIAAQTTPRSGAFPIFEDYVALPRDLAGLARTADAVVSVRVANARIETTADAGGRAHEVTRYTLTLLAILKPHSMLPPIPAPLQITRLGGDRTFVVGFEPFQIGSEYVLFLTWNQRTDAFEVAYGPHGSYQLLQSGVVRALGSAELAKNQNGKPRDAFEQEIRSAAGR